MNRKETKIVKKVGNVLCSFARRKKNENKRDIRQIMHARIYVGSRTTRNTVICSKATNIGPPNFAAKNGQTDDTPGSRNKCNV